MPLSAAFVSMKPTGGQELSTNDASGAKTKQATSYSAANTRYIAGRRLADGIATSIRIRINARPAVSRKPFDLAACLVPEHLRGSSGAYCESKQQIQPELVRTRRL
jgi:hypothetical protein